jgi:hypothetical protein
MNLLNYHLKSGRLDAEALVVDILEETVRLKLYVTALSSSVFIKLRPMGAIVSTKYDGTPPISIGDLVSFSYAFTTKDNIPVDIEIKHIRHDISWLELMRREYNDGDEPNQTIDPMPVTGGIISIKFSYLNLSPLALMKLYHQMKPRKEYGFWTQYESKNIKDFLEVFAKSRGINPLLAESWYPVTQEDLLNEEVRLDPTI